MNTKDTCICCYFTEKDRISNILSKKEGYIKTILLLFTNITINYECLNSDGWIKLQLTDVNNNLCNESVVYFGNQIDQLIEWKNIVLSNNYYVTFFLHNCKLFNFKYYH